MSEYIDRDKIFAIWRSNPEPVSMESLAAAIHQTPAADVTEVRHGYWWDVGSLSCRCSECGCKANRESAYCPNCGAKMDKEEA